MAFPAEQGSDKINCPSSVVYPSTVTYPASDGKPMGETELHVRLVAEFLTVLGAYLQDESDLYVAANMMVYYHKGDRKKRFAPDLFAVRGVDRRVRRSWFTWKEGGRVPDFVLEVVSESSYLEDQGNKKVESHRCYLRTSAPCSSLPFLASVLTRSGRPSRGRFPKW